MLRRRDFREPDIFLDVGFDEAGDIRRRHIHPILENAVEQQTLAVFLRLHTLEIHKDGIDAVDLLIRLRLIVANGNEQHEQVGMVVGDFRQELDEIERPFAPRILLGVRQAVIPGLKFVQQ